MAYAQHLAIIETIVIIVIIMAMLGPRPLFANMKRGPPANDEIDDSTRMLLRSELLATARGSKANVARILQTLNRKGMLRDSGLGSADERRQLQRAAEMHGRARTPYGTVVQTLDVPGIGRWEFVHPIAFMHYMSTVSEPFAKMVSDAIDKAPLFQCSLVFFMETR